MDRHQRLVTISQVKQEALGSFDVTEEPGATSRAIEYATRQVENYLQRRLIIRERTTLGRDVDLEYDHDVSSDQEDYFSFYLGDWPVLESISIDPDEYNLQVHPDGRRFFTEVSAADFPIRQVDYYAGYRREDQGLSGLQSKDGLSGLTVEPPVLPAQIRSTTIRIALHRLQAMLGEGYGLGSRSLQVGQGQTITTAQVDEGFVQRELESLSRYRSIAW